MDSSSEKDLSLRRLKNVIKDIKLDCNKLFAVEEKINEESTSNVLNECVDTENKSLPTPRCSESLQKDITTVSDNDNNDDYKEGSNLTTLGRDTNTCTNIINVSDKNSSLSSEQTKKKICEQESESVSSNNQLHKYKIEKELQIVLTPIKKRMQLEQCVIGDKNENICKKPVPQVRHTDDSENKRNSLDKSNEINDTTSEENLGEKILATSGTVNNSNSDDLMDTVFSVEKKSSETKEKQATQQDIIMVTADNVSENKINSLNKSNEINDTTCNENLGKKILATLGTENNSNSDDVNDTVFSVGKKSLETKEKQTTQQDIIMVTTDNVSENKRNSLDESNEISDTTCNENLGEKILATSRTENNSNSDDFSDTVPSFGKKSLEAKEKQTIQQVIILGTTDNSSLEGIETSSKEGNIVVVNDETLKEDSSLDLLENSVVDYEIKQNKKETGNKIDVSNGEPVLNKAKNIEQNEILTSKLQNDKQSSKKLINSDSDILLLQHPKNEAFVTNTQTIPLQLESTGNDVEYFGTHKTFCELLDQCSPKKQNYSQDNKVSNKIIEKQSDAQSVEHEVQNDKEEIIKNSDFRSVINEDEKENKSEHEIKRDLNFEQVTEKIAQTVFETNVSNTVCNSEDSVTIVDSKNITGDTDINTVKLNSNENINSIQQNNFREKQSICLKDQECSDEIFGASVEICSVTVKENKNNESSHKNLAKDKIDDSQKRKNTKVEAKVELCSVVKVINNSEDILVASGKQNLFKKKNFKTKVFHESNDDFMGNNEQGLEVQYIQKSEKNKTTGNGMNAKIPQAFDVEPNKKSKKNKTSTIETKDDIVKRKKEKRFVISEVKDSDENIPESTRINSKKRLHEEIEQKDSIKTIPESNNVNSKKRLHKKDDLNIDEDDTKKVKAENKLSDDKVSENVCDQLKTNTRKLNNQFKKTLKNIDFAELLQLLTVPNEQVKLLNLSQNYLRKLKGKILKSTEYKNFTDIVQKKNIGDKKLEQNKTKSNSKATLRSDEWDRLISDEHGTVGVLNKESNESGILNRLQSSDKVMKKRKRNRRKKKNQMGSVNNSSESTAEVVEINQVDTRISQIKKQNKTDIGKNLDQLTSKINKKENINRKQETDQQFIKPKLIIEDTIPLKSNQEFFAVKSDNIPTKFPEKKIKHDRFKNKEVSIKEQVNENENQKKQKLKHKMSVQPNFLKTTGSLFKVEASNVFGSQHKSIVKDPKESSICSGSLFKVEASSKSEDQRQHTVGTKEPPGFIVTDGTKGKHEIISDKSILFAGSNLQEFRNSKEPPGFIVTDGTKGKHEIISDKSILFAGSNLQEFRNSKEYKASLELMKQNVETTNENNMFKFSDKPKKNKRSREQTTSPRNEPNEQQKKVGIKRLPAELLEALSDKPLEKKKKEIPIETKEISKNKKKKLKFKSAILDESYIPLSADSATQFAVARLDKEPTLTSAQHAANFRNNQLYGVHTKRISAKDLHNMKLKIKANNKE